MSVVASHNNWLVYQMDVKSSFLNGIMSEEVYVNHRPGYKIYGEDDPYFMRT